MLIDHVALVELYQLVGYVVTHAADFLAVIPDADEDAAVVLVGIYVDGYLSSCGGVASHIWDNQQQYFVDFIRVYPSHHAFRLALDDKFYPFVFHNGGEFVGKVPDILHNIIVTDVQLGCIQLWNILFLWLFAQL